MFNKAEFEIIAGITHKDAAEATSHLLFLPTPPSAGDYAIGATDGTTTVVLGTVAGVELLPDLCAVELVADTITKDTKAAGISYDQSFTLSYALMQGMDVCSVTVRGKSKKDGAKEREERALDWFPPVKTLQDADWFTSYVESEPCEKGAVEMEPRFFEILGKAGKAMKSKNCVTQTRVSSDGTHFLSARFRTGETVAHIFSVVR